MKRSPYRSYLEGEIYEPDEVVYYKIIATDGMITGMEAALRSLLSEGQVRAVIRPQTGAEGISGLYLYSSKASIEHAEKVVMWMLREENPSLLPMEVFSPDTYRSEVDAMRLLHRIANAYEPIGLLPKKKEEMKAN